MTRDTIAVLTELAAGQWGLVTSAQAGAAGVSRVQLTRLTSAGLLIRVVHGVYATPVVANDVNLELRAAWLALNPRVLAEQRLERRVTAGVVSHASAAALHGMGDLLADAHEFTLPRRYQTTRADVRVHRATLSPDEVRIIDGLPTTSPERTVVDLIRTSHDLEHIAGVVDDGLRLDKLDAAQLARALDDVARRRGASNGGQLLDQLLDLSGKSIDNLGDQLLQTTLGRRLVRHALAERTEVSDHVDVKLIPAARGLSAMADVAIQLPDGVALVQIKTALDRLARDPQMLRTLKDAAQVARRLQDSPALRDALAAMQWVDGLSPSLKQALDTYAEALPSTERVEVTRLLEAAAERQDEDA